MDFEAIRAYCLSLPHATEDIKWEHDLCFSIGGKMFAVMYTEKPFSCSFKVQEEEFAMLSISPDIIPAPYMARHNWVQVKNEGRFTPQEWQKYLRHSYELVRGKLPKKQRDALMWDGQAPESATPDHS